MNCLYLVCSYQEDDVSITKSLSSADTSAHILCYSRLKAQHCVLVSTDEDDDLVWC